MGLYQSHALKRKRLNYFVRNERAGGVGERAISSSIYFMFMLLWLLPYTYTHSLLLPPFFVSFSSFFLSFSAIGLEWVSIFFVLWDQSSLRILIYYCKYLRYFISSKLTAFTTVFLSPFFNRLGLFFRSFKVRCLPVSVAILFCNFFLLHPRLISASASALLRGSNSRFCGRRSKAAWENINTPIVNCIRLIILFVYIPTTVRDFCVVSSTFLSRRNYRTTMLVTWC